MMLPKSVIPLFLCFLSLVVAEKLLVTLPNGSPIHGHPSKSHSGRGIRSFTNIPYAEPPVGDLRFADPVPKAPWTGELGNSNKVFMCPQEDLSDSRYLGQEDCLYLNVHVPMNPKSDELLPVMFYIHGGAFTSGSGIELVYSPEFLLDEDVILVSGNYRLGPLGFLSTFTDDFPGNYGMKDQVLMLKWIQENIQVFGGDPKKVTIFGESAGGASVSYHLLSPMSQGLFQQGIIQSGTAFEPWAHINPTQSLTSAEELLKVVGCDFSRGNYKTALECMRKKEAQEIVMSMRRFQVLDVHPLVTFAPVNEINSRNAFLTEENYLNVEASSDLPVMIGVVAEEGALFVGRLAADPDLVADLERNFDEKILKILVLNGRFDEETGKQKVKLMKQHYFNGADFSFALHKNDLARLMTDILFLPGLPRFIRNKVKTGNGAKTFAYLFNYCGAASFGDIFQGNSNTVGNCTVGHVDDLLYLFPMVKNLINFRVMTEEDHQVREQIVKMWTNFAKFGNPSTEKVEWTPVIKFPIDYMRIGICNSEVCDPESKTKTSMQTGLFEKNLQFIGEFGL